ncbi:MAG: metallophosphoesterase [Candidatus Pacearchaeota archaeon]|nr:metallophosphoesterase [Candidatus Pacearchaeota archaeon]
MNVVQELMAKGYLIETNFLKSDILEQLLKLDKDLFFELIFSMNPPKIINKNFFIKTMPLLVEKLKKYQKEETFQIASYFSEKYLKKEEKKEEVFEESNNLDIIQEYDVKARKIEVEDFVEYFRSRYKFFKNILQERIENIVSIGKIFGNRRNIFVIGIVYDKKYTKNKNILLELEDLSGKIVAIVNKDKKEVFEKASSVVLDEVIAVKASGNREVLFVEDIIFPDIILKEKKYAKEEEYAIFIADLHIGSNKFLEENFLKFISWINGKIGNERQEEIAKKVKYLFIVGDLVDGVGIYPNQEKELKIKDIYEQYKYCAELLKKIRKDIKIIVCPGNHDAVRLLEPQPKFNQEIIDIFNSENIFFTTNPSLVNIGKTKNFEGFNVLLYHGRSLDYYIDKIDFLRLSNAKLDPALVLEFLLKKRHLGPAHASTNILPVEDALALKKIPDIIVTAHVHRSAVLNYNNILVISCSCFQSRTSYQEKLGHEPDPCKICLFNLKTRKLNILDFS